MPCDTPGWVCNERTMSASPKNVGNCKMSFEVIVLLPTCKPLRLRCALPFTTTSPRWSTVLSGCCGWAHNEKAVNAKHTAIIEFVYFIFNVQKRRKGKKNNFSKVFA